MGEPHHDVCLPFFGAFSLPPLFSAPPLGCVCFFRSHLPMELPIMNSLIYIYIIYTANIVLLSLGTCRFETNPFFSPRIWHGVERSRDLTDLLQSEQLE